MITEDVEKFFQQFKWKRIQRDWKRASVVMDSTSTHICYSTFHIVFWQSAMTRLHSLFRDILLILCLEILCS